MHDDNELRELSEQVDSGARKAIRELIKVLNDDIFKEVEGDGKKQSSEVVAEKLKLAAQAKRLAFDDARYMLSELKKGSKDEVEEKKPAAVIPDTFAERRAKK